MILVDTSVWIDFFNGFPSKEEIAFKSLLENEEDICLSAVNLMEILQGIKKKTEFLKVEHYLNEFSIFIPEKDSYILAALIFKKCQKKGHTVKSADCLIAATAIENDLTLLHKDKDFNYIQNNTELKVLSV